MEVHTFNLALEAEAGDMSLRSVWSTERVQDIQGYSEKPYLVKSQQTNKKAKHTLKAKASLECVSKKLSRCGQFKQQKHQTRTVQHRP